MESGVCGELPVVPWTWGVLTTTGAGFLFRTGTSATSAKQRVLAVPGARACVRAAVT